MRVKDLLAISSKNIRVYFRRNLMLVIVMGAIFGLIFAMNLLIQGIENSYTGYATRVTGGKVVIMAKNSQMALIADEAGAQVGREEMVEDIEKYGGRVIGDTEKYGMLGNVVLPRELVEGAIEVDMDTVPVDAAPIIVSVFDGEQLAGLNFPAQYKNATDKLRDYEALREALVGKTLTNRFGAKYHVVGMAVGGFKAANLSFQQLERTNANPLNILLERIMVSSGMSIVVDNGRSEEWERGDSSVANPFIEPEQSVVAVFDDTERAYEYFSNGKAAFAGVSFPNKTYFASVVAGLSPEVTYLFRGINTIMGIASVVLGLIAVVVVIFTSIRLIDQDKRNIALYYSLGATTRQVRGIYWCYFLELMLGALIFAFGAASALVVIFSLINQELLGIQAAVSFGLPDVPQVMWYGMNWGVVATAVLMLMVSFLCVGVNRKGLGNRQH